MAKKLIYYMNYSWRVLATGCCFAFFGIGAIILVYIIIPIIGKNRAQLAISHSFSFFIFIMESFGVMKAEFKNFEKLQNDHGCLIISNHPTLLDYVLIVSKLKKCNTIVKEKLWQNIFLKKIVQLANYISNEKVEQLFPLLQNSLNAGENILIFPEGTRTTINKPLKLKRGAAQISIRLGIPIRVIKIECKPITLTKGKKWYNVPKTKAIITLEACELIDPSSFLRDTNQHSLAARHLTNHLQNILTKDIQREKSRVRN